MKKFTFYKLLSLALILVLSVATIKSFKAPTVIKANALSSTETSKITLDEKTTMKLTPMMLKTNAILDINTKIKLEELAAKNEKTTEKSEESIEEENKVEETAVVEEVKEEPSATVTEEVKKEEPVEKKQEVITGSQVVGTYSEWEIYEWAKIVHCEARGESQKCREYVAQVILNRVNSPKFPNTIHNVIFSGKQFSPTFDGSWERLEPNQAAYDAVYTVINASQPLTNALFFEACRGDSWHSRNLTEVAEVDNTRFYIY